MTTAIQGLGTSKVGSLYDYSDPRVATVKDGSLYDYSDPRVRNLEGRIVVVVQRSKGWDCHWGQGVTYLVGKW